MNSHSDPKEPVIKEEHQQQSGAFPTATLGKSRRACDTCRGRKIKCVPSASSADCDNCTKKNLRCTFRDAFTKTKVRGMPLASRNRTDVFSARPKKQQQHASRSHKHKTLSAAAATTTASSSTTSLTSTNTASTGTTNTTAISLPPFSELAPLPPPHLNLNLSPSEGSHVSSLSSLAPHAADSGDHCHRSREPSMPPPAPWATEQQQPQPPMPTHVLHHSMTSDRVQALLGLLAYRQYTWGLDKDASDQCANFFSRFGCDHYLVDYATFSQLLLQAQKPPVLHLLMHAMACHFLMSQPNHHPYALARHHRAACDGLPAMTALEQRLLVSSLAMLERVDGNLHLDQRLRSAAHHAQQQHPHSHHHQDASFLPPPPPHWESSAHSSYRSAYPDAHHPAAYQLAPPTYHHHRTPSDHSSNIENEPGHLPPHHHHHRHPSPSWANSMPPPPLPNSDPSRSMATA